MTPGGRLWTLRSRCPLIPALVLLPTNSSINKMIQNHTDLPKIGCNMMLSWLKSIFSIWSVVVQCCIQNVSHTICQLHSMLFCPILLHYCSCVFLHTLFALCAFLYCNTDIVFCCSGLVLGHTTVLEKGCFLSLWTVFMAEMTTKNYITYLLLNEFLK